ncbi:MAG: hypothetical protein KBA79_01640 [Candidatus Cloacimonetes bacterium]|nr:hypothetical protein [Candidatus Cloacimonadota bacterium]
MPRYLWLVFCAALWICVAQAQISPVEITAISQSIAARVITGEPIILEIRAGEWSQALANEIRRQLLIQGADIREAGLGQHSPAISYTEGDSSEVEEYDLRPLKLDAALLVLVEMELRWQTVERGGFLSYSSQRKPVYVFNLKQISLPTRQLRHVSSLSHEFQSGEQGGSATTGIKWFEPMLVTAALASIIYLLWTTE